MPRLNVEMELDLPEGVEFREYHRYEEGHAFHVDWAWPERCRCETCGREGPAQLTVRNTFHTARDLDIWGQPCFFVYQPVVHRCDGCGHRQYVPVPFKRKDVKYTYRFEEEVLRLLIGSTEEEVAERLGISAETVARIVRQRLTEGQALSIDPQRNITDVGLDEISLKKRHKLYVTILTDLSEPERPRILALASGHDEAAARTCLAKLSEAQRAQVRVHRTDMCPAYLAACAKELPHSQSVLDRFHVMRQASEISDHLRKKNHQRLPEFAPARKTSSLSQPDVGVSQAAARSECRGATAVGGPVCGCAGVGPDLPMSGTFGGNL